MKILSIGPDYLYETGPIIVETDGLEYTDINLLIDGVQSTIKFISGSIIKATIPQIPESDAYDVLVQIIDRNGRIIFSDPKPVFINKIREEDLRFRFPPALDHHN